MLKRSLFLLILWVNFAVAWSQDTTVVQTFTFASNTRAGMFQFPLDTATWSKIIMQYRMRCKNALISTQTAPNQGCGEWDYSCNTYITDSSLIDSVKATHNNYTISNFSGSTYPYTNSPTYSYTQYQQQAVTYDSTLNETLSTIGNGSVITQYLLSNGKTSGKSQYLFTASELSAAGLVAGDIHSLTLNLSNVATEVGYLRIKMKPTTTTALSQIDLTSGWQQVYFLTTNFPTTGLQRLAFYQPFNWDGISNILLEVNYNNAIQSLNNLVLAEFAPTNTAITSISDDYAVECDGFDDYINAGDLDDLDGATKFTYEGWVNIKNWKNWVNIFGKNGKTLLQTGDVSGNLYCIIRNPTNDYGYATGVLPLNTWTHVAMTYDGSQTGNANRLKLYINGAPITLTYNGTIPATTDISTEPLRMADISGAMDDARVWKTALSATTIADWMRKSLDNSHPDFANLIAAYQMDEGMNTTLLDASGNGNYATITNGGMWQKFTGNDFFKNLAPIYVRPNLIFAQGNYLTSIDTIITLDSVVNQPNTVIQYTVQNNNLQTVDTTTTWLTGYTYIKDEAGMVIDSVLIAANDTLQIYPLNYFSKWAQKLELMSFVTPYGKGLDLGVDGKMWEFDVTDFAPILKNKKYINLQNGGEWQEDMDIRFLFIKGTPPRNVLSIQQIWPVTADAYAQINANNRFEPRSVTLNNDANFFKIRSAITGHGQQGEFIQRQHYINLNGGANDFQWNVWKECALNPVYPQGGTWVYDRAG
ncbi:MAG: LamG-like jellyroll fold domain-containing protein, partial [Bacteroidia bacterium]